MPDCPKCGTKVREEMNFCPKCGTSLKAAQPQVEATTLTSAEAQPTMPTPVSVRIEKQEKHEKEERWERHEKQESGYMGPLMGGFVLIVIGFIFYLLVTVTVRWEAVGALFFVLLGLIVIIGAVYAAMMAARRHPQT